MSTATLGVATRHPSPSKDTELMTDSTLHICPACMTRLRDAAALEWHRVHNCLSGRLLAPQQPAQPVPEVHDDDLKVWQRLLDDHPDVPLTLRPPAPAQGDARTDATEVTA